MTVDASDEQQRTAWLDGSMPPVVGLPGEAWAVPVPIERSRIRYTYAHVLACDTGLLVIDPGWESSWSALEDGLAQLNRRVSDVVGVLVTHGHGDHHGLTEQLLEASGAWLAMSPLDGPRHDEATADVSARWALHRSMGVELRRRSDAGSPPADTRVAPSRPLADGDVVEEGGRRLRVLSTPGHTAGHVCFLDEDHGVLYSGDHLLPGITPNVSVNSRQTQNPLADYLASLQLTADLDVTRVACAHEFHFDDAERRSTELIGHHRRRLARLAEETSREPGRTCWELTHSLAWGTRLADAHRRTQLLAARETLAHLVYLEAAGSLRRESGDDGDRWFTAQE